MQELFSGLRVVIVAIDDALVSPYATKNGLLWSAASRGMVPSPRVHVPWDWCVIGVLCNAMVVRELVVM